MRSDPWIVVTGAVLTLALLVLSGYIVAMLGPGDPWVIGGVLTSVGALLATLPPIIKAMRGR